MTFLCHLITHLGHRKPAPVAAEYESEAGLLESRCAADVAGADPFSLNVLLFWQASCE